MSWGQRGYRDDEHAVRTPVCIGGHSADDAQDGRGAPLVGEEPVDPQEVLGGGVYLPCAELYLECTPSSILQFHDGIDFSPATVTVVEQMSSEVFRIYLKVMFSQGLEEHSESVQIVFQHLVVQPQ